MNQFLNQPSGTSTWKQKSSHQTSPNANALPKKSWAEMKFLWRDTAPECDMCSQSSWPENNGVWHQGWRFGDLKLKEKRKKKDSCCPRWQANTRITCHVGQGSHTVEKWFLWKHTTFQDLWSRKELCVWTGTLMIKWEPISTMMRAHMIGFVIVELYS